MKIKFLIRKDFYIADSYAGVTSVEEPLLKHNCVVVFEKDKFCGILTYQDVVEAGHRLVIDCISRKPFVNSEDDIEIALDLMKRHLLQVLPVMDHDEFAGIITQADILDYFEEYNQELECRIRDHTKSLLKKNMELEQEIRVREKVELQRDNLISRLQESLDQVKTLKGMLPICAACKKIRDDEGYWTQIEDYIRRHSDAEFSHGLCPDCAKKLYPKFC